MKHTSTLVLIAIAALLCGCERILSEEPSVDQSHYFKSQIANTERIEIKEHPKLGGRTLAEITDPKEILKICIDIQLKRVHAPTASFGRLNLIFHTIGGGTFEINYSPEQNRMKFESQWNIEGIPYDTIPKRITKHLET